MLSKSQKEDYHRYYVENPKDFNPARSYAIIDECIKAADLDKKNKIDIYTEKLRERVEAAVSYIYWNKSHLKSVEQYLGKDYLAKMQGQRILQKAKRLSNGKEIITLEEVV